MDSRNPEEDPPVFTLKRSFRETALGKLISTTSNSDTAEVLSLLQAKKNQIREMQKKLTETSKSESVDPERITKSKYCLMPSIRKTPVKPVFILAETPVPKQKAVIERPLPEELELFWSKMTTTGWKPETRQEATLTNVDNKLYLIGGVSRSINQDVNVCYPMSSRWEKLYPSGVEPDPRFGHSAIEYRGKIIVFGGGTNFNTVHKLRECLNGIKVFHPDQVRWEYLKTSGTYIATRKYHSAALVGKHMFIYGGLNQKNNLLSDCALLNLEKSTLKSIHFEGPLENAFHTSATVVNPDQKTLVSIYNVPASRSGKIKRPGVYVFGGIGPDRKAHNLMWVVTVGQRPLKWTLAQTEGQGPSPRFMHSMIFHERQNYVMIFGGRIDVSQSKTYTCFNDVFLLCVQRMLWVRVKVLGEVPPARSGHCACAVNTSMLVFGGVSNTFYCSSDIYTLETNSACVTNLMQKDEKKKQFMIEVENYKANKEKKARSVTSGRRSGAFSRMSSTPSKEYMAY